MFVRQSDRPYHQHRCWHNDKHFCYVDNSFSTSFHRVHVPSSSNLPYTYMQYSSNKVLESLCLRTTYFQTSIPIFHSCQQHNETQITINCCGLFETIYIIYVNIMRPSSTALCLTLLIPRQLVGPRYLHATMPM